MVTAVEWWSYFTVGAVLGLGILLIAWLMCDAIQEHRPWQARARRRPRYRKECRVSSPESQEQLESQPGRSSERPVTVAELEQRIKNED